MSHAIPMHPVVAWRATGPYRPNIASKAGLLAETQCFLQTYAQLGDVGAVRQLLVDGALPQRARETREAIVKAIHQRLVRWSPPQWVLDDLARMAVAAPQVALPAALLFHVVRQDCLLYDVVQHVVVPRWKRGERVLIRADVQHFLDQAQALHPEIDHWSFTTRAKLAGNVLSVLRDYGLLQGRDQKQIVEPLVPEMVVAHVLRVLQAEEGGQRWPLPTLIGRSFFGMPARCR